MGLKKTYKKVLTPINIIGFVLTMLAGWVDTVGLCIFLNNRASFMTGRAAELGKYIYIGDIQEIKIVLLIIISFILGACISTLVTKKIGLTGGLTFTGLLIIITAIFSIFQRWINIALITIPMSMGGQNAATSLTVINRTTHLTGPVTDIGINMACGNWNLVVFWVLRWIGFSLGVIAAYELIHIFKTKTSYLPYLLLIPGCIIILIAILQKIKFHIPLINEEKTGSKHL